MATTLKYDAAKYIGSPEDAAAYLDAAFTDGDARVIRAALNNIARAYGMGKLANGAHIGRQSLYKSLSEDGNPQFDTVLKIIEQLGLKLSVTSAQ